jgi:hypothetical protein
MPWLLLQMSHHLSLPETLAAQQQQQSLVAAAVAEEVMEVEVRV